MILSPPIYPIHSYILYHINYIKTYQTITNNIKIFQTTSNLLLILFALFFYYLILILILILIYIILFNILHNILHNNNNKFDVVWNIVVLLI